MSLDLYQKEILALAKRGSTPERLDAPDASARVDNALCGDRVTIDVTAVSYTHLTLPTTLVV